MRDRTRLSRALQALVGLTPLLLAGCLRYTAHSSRDSRTDGPHDLVGITDGATDARTTDRRVSDRPGAPADLARDSGPPADHSALPDLGVDGKLADAPSLVDVSPTLDTAKPVDMSQLVDTAWPRDSVPPIDTARPPDSVPPIDTARPPDSVPPIDTAQLKDTAAPVDLALPDSTTGTPTHAWSMGFGNVNHDYGRAVAVDASGNVYVTGSFADSVSFGGATLTSAGLLDIFVASFTPSGAHRWSARFGSTGNDEGMDIAVDAAGNVYVAGAFNGAVDFGGGTLTSAGLGDVFVASFTTTGAYRWSRRFGGTGEDGARGVAVDSSSVAVTGSFQATVDFGAGSKTSAGLGDIFVLSLVSSTGANRWSLTTGDSQDDFGGGAALDGSGNVYATGAFQGTASCGGASLASSGKQDIFVCSFSSTGAHRWSRSHGGNQFDLGLAVAADASGNVFVSGSVGGAVSLGGAVVSYAGGADLFVASYTSAGAHRWSKAFGDTHDEIGYGASADTAGNFCVTGEFHNTVDFGGGALSSNGGADIVAASYASAGAHRWSRGFGSPTGIANDLGYDCAVDGSGNVYLVGVYRFGIDFGGTSLLNVGGYDIFLLKLKP